MHMLDAYVIFAKKLHRKVKRTSTLRLSGTGISFHSPEAPSTASSAGSSGDGGISLTVLYCTDKIPVSLFVCSSACVLSTALVPPRRIDMVDASYSGEVCNSVKSMAIFGRVEIHSFEVSMYSLLYLSAFIVGEVIGRQL